MVMDHKRALTAALLAGTVMLWDQRSGQVMGQYQGKGAVKALRFTPDGSKLVLCAENGDLKSLHLDGSVFLSHRLEDSPRCLATDGRQVVIGISTRTRRTLPLDDRLTRVSSAGTAAGYVSVLRLSSGAEIARYTASKVKAVNCLAVLLDGSRLIAGCEDSCLHIWHA